MPLAVFCERFSNSDWFLTGIETGRLAWMKAAWETDNNIRNSYSAAIAKAWCADMANKCASDAVQVSYIT